MLRLHPIWQHPGQCLLAKWALATNKTECFFMGKYKTDSEEQPTGSTLFSQSERACCTMILPLDFFWHFPEWLRRMNSPAVNYSLVWCSEKWNPRRCCLTQVPSAARCFSESCEMYLDVNWVRQVRPISEWHAICKMMCQVLSSKDSMCRHHVQMMHRVHRFIAARHLIKDGW